MNDFRGYRYGIPVIAIAVICSLLSVMVGSVSQPTNGILPQCIGQDALSDGPSFIDLFWTCSDGYRLSLMSLIGTVSILAVSILGYKLANRQMIVSSTLSLTLRTALAGITVGLLYLIGLYVYEFLYHHGYTTEERTLNIFIIAGSPIFASLMHFPNRWGILMAIPVFAAGFVSLVLIAWGTGIPLD